MAIYWGHRDFFFFFKWQNTLWSKLTLFTEGFEKFSEELVVSDAVSIVNTYNCILNILSTRPRIKSLELDHFRKIKLLIISPCNLTFQFGRPWSENTYLPCSWLLKGLFQTLFQCTFCHCFCLCFQTILSEHSICSTFFYDIWLNISRCKC